MSNPDKAQEIADNNRINDENEIAAGANKIDVPDGICLNNQTVDNLIKYLQQYPDNARVTIWHDYKTFDCQICCNFEHQKKTNTVQVMTGTLIGTD